MVKPPKLGSNLDRFGALITVMEALYKENERKVSVFNIHALVYVTRARKYYYDFREVAVPELNDTRIYSDLLQSDLDHLKELAVLKETEVEEDLDGGKRKSRGYEITGEGLERGAKLFFNILKKNK